MKSVELCHGQKKKITNVPKRKRAQKPMYSGVPPTNQPELEFHCLIANTLARKVVTVEIGPFVQVLFRFTRFEEQGSPGKTPLSVLFFGIRYYYSSGIRANSYCSTSIGLAAT